MTDFASHSDVGTSPNSNLSFLPFSVEPKVDLVNPQPLVMHDDVQGRKFDDHRKYVNEQVEVCNSIFENIVKKTYLYEELDLWGLDRPLALNFYGCGFYAYESYKDFSHLIPQIESTILKRRKMIEVFHEDGTFSHETEKYELFCRDLLIAPPEDNVFLLDVFNLPPDEWIYRGDCRTDHVEFRSVRKKRFQFFRVDVETGETRDVSRSYCSPYEPFESSSLRWVDFDKRSENLDECSIELEFEQILSAQGKKRLRLKTAEFCRQRLCPMCMWRRSMQWYSRFLERFELIVDAFQNYRLLHLVLTVPNVHITNLRFTLQRMNKAWKRMIDLKVKNPLFPEFKIVKGFLKSTEVTREYHWVEYTALVDGKKVKKSYKDGMGREGYCHPHFHVLLAVPAHYMSHGKIPPVRWLEVWRHAMQMPEIMDVDIDLVQGGRKFKDMELGSVEDFKKAILRRDTLFGALPEMVKYSTKPSEFSTPFKKGWETAEQRDFFYYKYEREVKHLRFISTAGIFKDILADDDKTDDVTNEEMVKVGGSLSEGETVDPDTLKFTFDKEGKHYFLTWINYAEDYEE